jgi:hypothetical protein
MAVDQPGGSSWPLDRPTIADLRGIVMSRIQSIRRLAGFVAGLATAVLAAAVSAPAALAVHVPPPGGTRVSPPVVVQTHTIVQGGMPGWQIALIALGAALAAAVLAVLVYRARLARHQPATAVAAPAATPTRVG